MIDYFINGIIFTLENMGSYGWFLMIVAFLLGMLLKRCNRDNKDGDEKDGCEKKIEEIKRWFKDNLSDLIDEIDFKNFKGFTKKISSSHYEIILTDNKDYKIIFDIFLGLTGDLVLISQVEKLKNKVPMLINFDITVTNNFETIGTLMQKIIT